MSTNNNEAGALRAPALVMEDHREAYFFWKRLGLREAACIHVDAHLDACGFKVPGDPWLKQPDINCGNYLLPAIRDGIVAELVWVVPPHLKAQQDLLSWTQQELQAWLHLSLSEYASLQLVEGRVEGRLAGVRLVVCESDKLPRFDRTVLLDIDVDYYLGPSDEVWQTPLQLASHLAELDPAALTVAYSVEGGYTPVRLRYLGDLTLLAHQQPDEALRLWRCLHTQKFPTGPDGPNWLRAAATVSLAGEDYEHPGYARAAEIDSGYTLRDSDVACLLLHRQRFDEIDPWLERMAQHDPVTASYLGGFIDFRQGRYREALAAWDNLRDVSEDKTVLRHLLEMRALTEAALELWTPAARSFQNALRLDPRDANLWIGLARAQRRAGLSAQAARSYRRAASLEPELLVTAQANLELLDLYQELGQKAMAQALRARMAKQNLPPELRMQLQVRAVKMAVRRT